MNIATALERKTATRRCPQCKRLLGTAIIQISGDPQVLKIIADLVIEFGNRTKCHRCKRVDEYLTELV